MYEELVNNIEKATLIGNPDLRSEGELRAAITHWLDNPKFYFKFRTESLVELWQTTLDEFCSNVGVALADIKSEVLFKGPKKGRFEFIDLFSGIGGFRLSLQANGGSCVFSSEWDKAAKQTYFKNYGTVPFGDINQFTDDSISDEELDLLIPDHRVLAGGFPCQPFSRAGVSARSALGKAHGFDCSTQGTLFHSIARITYVKQPEIVFMENVRNIVSHNNGETFKVIRETMENMGDVTQGKQGYVFQYALINSESIVPQRRVRCYMVCVRKDIWLGKDKVNYEFPEFLGEAKPLRDALDELTPSEIQKYTISDKLWSGHINRTKRNIDRNAGFTAYEADLDKPSNTIVARYGKDGKECLVPQKGINPRMLTPKECSKLFGYPDNFWIPSSRTPAYKQFGNSVVVPVIEKISRKIVDYLISE